MQNEKVKSKNGRGVRKRQKTAAVQNASAEGQVPRPGYRNAMYQPISGPRGSTALPFPDGRAGTGYFALLRCTSAPPPCGVHGALPYLFQMDAVLNNTRIGIRYAH
jgi:hypothetical protein